MLGDLHVYLSTCVRLLNRIHFRLGRSVLLNPVLLLNFGGVVRQRVQDLVQVAGGFIQPVDRILKFLCANFFFRQAITNLVARSSQQVC